MIHIRQITASAPNHASLLVRGSSVISTVASQQKEVALSRGLLPVCVGFVLRVNLWVFSGLLRFLPLSIVNRKKCNLSI